MPTPRRLWPLGLIIVSGGWLFSDVVLGLINDWAHDDNYSHGFLIVPLTAYFAWERRGALKEAKANPSWLGIAVILLSLGMLVAGLLGAEFFLSRVSLIGAMAGTVLWLLGWQYLRILAFPLVFLLLMIPIPSIVFNQIAFPLQLFASRFGVVVMELANVPVLREGNIIELATTKLEVAEACSGIRSLVSLLTLGIVYGYFADSRSAIRTIIALATIPIAIVANGLRVAGTGILAHYLGSDVALGFFHTFSGWLMFVFAFAMLLAAMALVRRLAPPTTASMAPAEAGA